MKRFLVFLVCITLCVAGVYAWKRAHTVPIRGPEKYTLANEPPVEAAQLPSLLAIDAEFTKLVNSVVPSVVSITTTRRLKEETAPDLFEQLFGEGRLRGVPRERIQNSLGSGVIVSKEGHILTNNHVIAEVDEIKVQLSDGRMLPARLIGADEASDLAVLKIDAQGLTPLPFGNSDQVQVGQRVVAVGNPFGFEETVTQGIISAKGRHSSNSENEFLQTDAAINPGNSGGPLINLRGEIVAINTAIYSSQETATPSWQGVGFAIPSNFARTKLEAMLKSGRVLRSYLGVYIQNLPTELAVDRQLTRDRGVIVTQIFRDSPAERAGLQANDIILRLNGHLVANTQAFRSIISVLPIGSSVVVEYAREGRSYKTTAVIGEQPSA